MKFNRSLFVGSNAVSRRRSALPRFLRVDQAGQALTEFALLLPLLILILMGTIDLARVYMTQVTITNAAREGARYGSANHRITTDIQTYTVNEASGSGVAITPAEVTVTCLSFAGVAYATCSDPAITSGDQIRVSIQHSFPLMTTSLLGLANIQLGNLASMAITD